jgi:hypothetical protein
MVRGTFNIRVAKLLGKLQEPYLGPDDLLFGGHGVLPFAETERWRPASPQSALLMVAGSMIAFRRVIAFGKTVEFVINHFLGHLSISQPWEIDACSPSVSA